VRLLLPDISTLV